MTLYHPFLTLWGKTDRRPHADSMNYHPLLFHLYDVARSAAALWETLPAPIKTRMADALKMDVERAGTLFVLLAGLHDLGKSYPNFQNKAPQFLPNLDAAGFDFPNDIGKPHPHNFVSVPEAIRVLTGEAILAQPLGFDLAELLSYVLGAHHGIFPQSENLTPIAGRVLGENPQWQQARDWLVAQLKESISNASAAFPAPETTVEDFAFAPLLAAFISLADWFGSSKYFEMRGALDIETYRAISKQYAATALNESGWTAPPAAPDPADFAQIFAYLNTAKIIEPNDLQKKVAALLPAVQRPALWLIEEEMGAGKTEAAFSIFDHARIQGSAHGLYIAMPTQATSNAMHDRLGQFLRHRSPAEGINLILAHSHATLDPDYLARMEIAKNFSGPVYNEETGAEEGALLVQSWFTQNKQTLLAHYGVGTIDQALLGVLQTRHWFVRLFGLAGKVVVFDEVHAYDAYMNTLLVRLIEWLAELDCTVVLLSATLPKDTRLKLAEAYAKGAKFLLELPKNQAEYPRITLVEKPPEKGRLPVVRAEQSVRETPVAPKRIALFHRANTPEAVKTALLDAIPGDGCAIVVCNTVGGTQVMYDALKSDPELSDWRCLLFHARMPFKWRRRREKLVLRLYGKKSGRNGTRPRSKNILIATQVVEQSLDLDADFMASELAPVDLILQRIGRLWRHGERKRTAKEACFTLLYDVDANAGQPIIDEKRCVYAPYLLLRSWIALKDKTEIVLPIDIELLVKAAYDDPAPPEWIEMLAASEKELKKNQDDQKGHAKRVSVPIKPAKMGWKQWLRDIDLTLTDDDDPETHVLMKALTRDGDPSVTVVLCGTDEKGKALAPQPSGYITPEMAQRMMGFSLPISKPAIFKALKSKKPPDNWQKNAHLKHCRQIILENGITTVANLRLTLTKESGLAIKKEGK